VGWGQGLELGVAWQLASASQKTDDDQPPPSTIYYTRQPSLCVPLLGPTLAALDQLPDEALLQIMISVEVRSRKQ